MHVAFGSQEIIIGNCGNLMFLSGSNCGTEEDLLVTSPDENCPVFKANKVFRGWFSEGPN